MSMPRGVQGGALAGQAPIAAARASANGITTPRQGHAVSVRRSVASAPEPMTPLAERVLGEYREVPGLRLTARQAARLFGVTPEAADAVLHELRRASILARSEAGAFALIC